MRFYVGRLGLKRLHLWVLGVLSALALSTAAHAVPGAPYTQFIDAENVNDFFRRVDTQSTVAPAYRPQPGRTFPVKYLELPTSELHVMDSGLGEGSLRDQIFVQRNGKPYFRFFIHPESETLYRDLIARFGVAGTYLASPTASTRTLLAWDPASPGLPPLFLKLSLDRRQSGLGRVVPDWEVRRSVLVSKLAASIPEEARRQYGVSIIPEVAGAYVDQSRAMGSYIDTQQYTVFQHGMIYRDAGFLTRFPDHDILPLFALFSMRGDREPLLIEWWQASGMTFDDFLEQAVIEPFVRAIGFLVFEQGIIPDTHSQNIVVAVNRRTRRIEHVFNRDVGSMKVNLLLRWVKGLPVGELRTFNTAYDFKFRWAAEISGRPFLGWFYRHLFTTWNGQERSITPYVPAYDSSKILALVQKHLKTAIDLHLPLEGSAPASELFEPAVERHVLAYLERQRPRFDRVATPIPPSRMTEFVSKQESLGQTMELPRAWMPKSAMPESGYLATEHGVVYVDAAGGLRLAFVSAPSVERPTHYEVDAPFKRVFAGELLKSSRTAEGRPFAPESDSEEESSALPSIRFGSSENPSYQLADGHSRALSAHDSDGTLRLKVIQDITDLAPEAQTRVLQRAGNFWSPENRDGSYRLVPLRQLKTSVWRDVYRFLSEKERRSLPLRPSDDFTEIEFARQSYESLFHLYGSKVDRLRTKQEIRMALLVRVRSVPEECLRALTQRSF